jgi:hypothetical protein
MLHKLLIALFVLTLSFGCSNSKVENHHDHADGAQVCCSDTGTCCKDVKDVACCSDTGECCKDEAQGDCPADCDKPCCADKDAKECGPDCTKPCCAGDKAPG